MNLLNLNANDIKFLYKLCSYAEIKRKTDCWQWQKGKDKDGYALITYKGKTVRVTRLIKSLYDGEFPKEMFCCHTCDNPSCINPDHIFIGSAKENSRDREKKHRGRTQNQLGEKNHAAILTENVVLEIRKLHQEGMKECDIVRKFKLNQGTVSKILLRKRWKHI